MERSPPTKCPKWSRILSFRPGEWRSGKNREPAPFPYPFFTFVSFTKSCCGCATNVGSIGLVSRNRWRKIVPLDAGNKACSNYYQYVLCCVIYSSYLLWTEAINTKMVQAKKRSSISHFTVWDKPHRRHRAQFCVRNAWLPSVTTSYTDESSGASSKQSLQDLLTEWQNLRWQIGVKCLRG